MSVVVRRVFLCGCALVGALAAPDAVGAVRAGFDGPYPTRFEPAQATATAPPPVDSGAAGM